MPDGKKYDRILDALHQLLEDQTIQNISVSDIAKKAGMGKGSIYYYFPSKDAILDALIERNYEQPLKTAKALASQTEISPFIRMAMILQACRSSSAAFLNHNNTASGTGTSIQDTAFPCRDRPHRACRKAEQYVPIRHRGRFGGYHPGSGGPA